MSEGVGPRECVGLWALVVFPPTSCGSSGCNRRLWLVSEGVGPGSEGVVGVARVSSGFVWFLRLQSEGVAGVGGFGAWVCLGCGRWPYFLRLRLVPPVATGACGGSRRKWSSKREPRPTGRHLPGQCIGAAGGASD